MGQRTYLEGSRFGLFKTELLEAEQALPLGWFLAFDRADQTSTSRIEARARDAAARARARSSRINAGPRFRSLLDGFVALLEKQRGKVAIDAWELQDARTIDANLSHAALFDEMSDDDLCEWGLERDEDGVIELDPEAEASEVGIPLFGHGSYDWLRPASRFEEHQGTIIKRAFHAYRLESEASGTLRFTRGDLEVTVQLQGAGFVLSAKGLISRSRYLTERGLRAWAEHLASHAALLGTAAFWDAIPTLEADRVLLAEAARRRLFAALAVPARPGAPPFSIDLGALGHLQVEHVGPPEWTVHLHATLRPGPGDASWRAFSPDYFVSPADQRAVFDALVTTLIAEAATEQGAELSGRQVLTLFSDRLVPDRYDERFDRAQRLVMDETPASIVFAGQALIVLSAAGARVSFKVELPPFDRSLPVFVSGWWTAPSGDRFATILRIGDRTWRFDNQGALR